MQQQIEIETKTEETNVQEQWRTLPIAVREAQARRPLGHRERPHSFPCVPEDELFVDLDDIDVDIDEVLRVEKKYGDWLDLLHVEVG